MVSAPGLVEQICHGIETHGTYPLPPAQQAACPSGLFPDRAALRWMITQRFNNQEHQDALTRMGVATALEIGY